MRHVAMQGVTVDRLPRESALIVVDVQQTFDDPTWGERNNPLMERNLTEVLAAWRVAERPLIHVRHLNSQPGGRFHPGGAGFAVKPEARELPGEPILTKEVNSAFIGTALEARLRKAGIVTVVLVGLTTDHCVSTTARMAANIGFATVVVADATATFERTGPEGRHYSADEMHGTALASLNGEFGIVVSTAELLAAISRIAASSTAGRDEAHSAARRLNNVS